LYQSQILKVLSKIRIINFLFVKKFLSTVGLDLEKFNDKFTAVQCRKTEDYNPEKILQVIPRCKRRSKKSKPSSDDDSDSD
jgi:hypothetical protein